MCNGRLGPTTTYNVSVEAQILWLSRNNAAYFWISCPNYWKLKWQHLYKWWNFWPTEESRTTTRKDKSDDASLQPAACDATVYAKFFLLETFQVWVANYLIHWLKNVDFRTKFKLKVVFLHKRLCLINRWSKDRHRRNNIYFDSSF